jgi:hypothetical protein
VAKFLLINTMQYGAAFSSTLAAESNKLRTDAWLVTKRNKTIKLAKSEKKQQDVTSLHRSTWVCLVNSYPQHFERLY